MRNSGSTTVSSCTSYSSYVIMAISEVDLISFEYEFLI